MLKIRQAVNFLFECEFKVIALLSAFIVFGLALGSFYGFGLSLGQGTDLGAFLSTGYFELLVKTLVVLLSSFLLGYTVVGAPLILFVLLYWGTCCGLFMSAVASNLGFKGCLLFGILFSVFFLVSFFSLILISFSSLRLSLALFGVFKNDTRYVSPKVYSNPHIIRFLVFACFDAVSCAYCVYVAGPLVSLFY